MLTFLRAFRAAAFRPSMHHLRGVRMERVSGSEVTCGSGRPITGKRMFSNDSGCHVSGESFQYDEDYHSLLYDTEARLKQLLDSPTRYQQIEKREDRSDIPQSVIESLCLGKYISNYRHALLLRDPKELVIFRHFLTCAQPKTIIELGTFTGSSAVWFADTAALLDLECQVYSVDVDQSLISEEIKRIKPDKVTFIHGDRNKIKDARMLPSTLLQTLPHPWLVIEDDHEDLFVGLKYLNKFMIKGDYLVAENSDPRMPRRAGLHVLYDKDEVVPLGDCNLELLRKFLKEYGCDYRVDTFYTDLYGYNCTSHWHGFLRKI